MKKILLVGESWISQSTHFKGFDSFQSTYYEFGATSFVDVEEVRRTHPERILESAIKGMLPKNSLGRKIMTHLRIYAGSEHPHAAQNPTLLDK